MILTKERSKDVRYQEFKEVGPDCDERLMLQLGPTSFLLLYEKRPRILMMDTRHSFFMLAEVLYKNERAARLSADPLFLHQFGCF